MLRRLAPFDVRLHCTGRHRLPEETERELNLTFHESAQEMVPNLDVVTVNAALTPQTPQTPQTRGLFDDELIASMRRGAYIHGTTPHISGSTLSAQARHAAGIREILESFLAGTPIRDEYIIVGGGALAGTGARSYSAG